MTLQTPQEWVFNWLGLLCALLGPAYLLSRRWGWRGALLGLGAAPVLVCSWLAAECIVSYRSGAVRVPNLVDPYSTQLHPGSYGRKSTLQRTVCCDNSWARYQVPMPDRTRRSKRPT
jgi:hypothetical protein